MEARDPRLRQRPPDQGDAVSPGLLGQVDRVATGQIVGVDQEERHATGPGGPSRPELGRREATHGQPGRGERAREAIRERPTHAWSLGLEDGPERRDRFDPREERVEGRDALPDEAWTEPCARIESVEGGRLEFRHPPVTVGRPVDLVVVDEDERSVDGRADVGLDVVGARRSGQLEPGKRVLGRDRMSTTMTTDQGSGPDPPVQLMPPLLVPIVGVRRSSVDRRPFGIPRW